MALRGKLLANLSLAKSRPNQEEGYLSKCKRYLASIPSQDKNARKKLNFVSSSAQSNENAPDQSSKVLDPSKISPPSGSGMCLMWKTGQVSSGSDIDGKESSDDISGGDKNEGMDDNENDQLGNPISEGDPAPRTMCKDTEVPADMDGNEANLLRDYGEDIDRNEDNLLRDYGEDIDGNDNNLMRDYGEEERYDIQDKENRYADLSKKKTVRFERKTGKKSARAIQQSFKNGFVTLKKSLRELQKKNDLEPEFLLIVKNNAQKKSDTCSSVFAEKFLTLGAGELMERFCSKSGLQYNVEEFALVKGEGKSLVMDMKGTENAIANKNRKKGKKSESRDTAKDDSSSESLGEHEEPVVVETESSEEEVDIFNMRSSAKAVCTPGSSRIRDSGSLVFGNGSKQTSPELQKQRQDDLKARKEASKKVEVDILGAKNKVRMKKKPITKGKKKPVRF